MRDYRTIELKQLRYFAKVAEYLSITAAAERLNLPKSVVSKTLKQLEENLGVQLLERSTRVMKLTEMGQVLLPRAKSLLLETEYLYNDLQGMATSVAGHLTLAAPPALGQFLAKNIIPDFLKQWPQVTVSLHLSYGYENLFEKGVDLAFRFGGINDDRLFCKKVIDTERILVASNAYLAQSGTPTTLKALQQHQCLLFQSSVEQSSWTFTNGELEQTIEVGGPFRCSDLQTLKSMALADIGIAQLPLFFIGNEVNNGQLQRILPQWATPKQPLSLVYRQGLDKPPKLVAFLDWMEQNLNTLIRLF